jgi:hypothetical protein
MNLNSRLDALRSDLQPILGNATAAVVGRLAAVIEAWPARDDDNASRGETDRARAKRLLARLDEFFRDFSTWDSGL